ncbi:hypothetical protein ACJIZ3_022255 [Penstemon smallii]|uniref:Uncharacterized protein n=1 Tax=Penstemon smallii TaxID=265156 RepID=A0ABD3TKS8_9LAMI
MAPQRKTRFLVSSFSIPHRLFLSIIDSLFFGFPVKPFAPLCNRHFFGTAVSRSCFTRSSYSSILFLKSTSGAFGYKTTFQTPISSSVPLTFPPPQLDIPCLKVSTEGCILAPLNSLDPSSSCKNNNNKSNKEHLSQESSKQECELPLEN